MRSKRTLQLEGASKAMLCHNSSSQIRETHILLKILYAQTLLVTLACLTNFYLSSSFFLHHILEKGVMYGHPWKILQCFHPDLEVNLLTWFLNAWTHSTRCRVICHQKRLICFCRRCGNTHIRRAAGDGAWELSLMMWREVGVGIFLRRATTGTLFDMVQEHWVFTVIIGGRKGEDIRWHLRASQGAQVTVVSGVAAALLM